VAVALPGQRWMLTMVASIGVRCALRASLLLPVRLRRTH